MELSRVVVTAGLIACGLAPTTPDAFARQSAPKLNRQQRTTLEAVVTAVDAAGSAPGASTSDWTVHVLRASDGSHYVALRALAPDIPPPRSPVTLYVRLALRRSETASSAPQRSAVLEWLRGQRSDPLPMQAARSMTVPQGELPVGGAASSVRNPDAAMEASSALRLAERERERVARQREEAEKRRRDALEQAAKAGVPVMHPFEDFDVNASLGAEGGGTAVLRSVRAGPGDYVLTVAWAEPGGASDRPPAVHVLSHPLSLPAASPAFAVSDIILADAVHTLDAAYPASQLNAHPYAVGALEALPARDDVFRVDESLSVVFQVINAAAGEAGKPDVDVAFRVTRVVGDRDEVVGNLPSRRFTAATLPADFDVAKGHPLFVAVQAPLARFARGRYRLAITALDQVSGQRATREVVFAVAGTARSLLSEAPAPGQAFRREAVLTPPVLAALARALTPPAPSEMLARALASAANGRFADLVREPAVTVAERPTAQALRALGLYGLGDTSRAVAAQLRQAATQGAPPGPVLLLLGATSAIAGDDKGAITAWNQARGGGIDDGSVSPLLVDAYLRQGDVARATAMARAALDARPEDPGAARGLAGTRIVAGQYADALAVLDARSAPDDDLDSAFLVIHALYASYVSSAPPGNTAEGRDRLQTVGRRYVEAGGRHAPLVKDWLAMAAVRPPLP